MPTKRYSRNRTHFRVKFGAFFKMCMGHHGHFVQYDESNPKAYARDHLGPKSMFPPGFTVKK